MNNQSSEHTDYCDLYREVDGMSACVCETVEPIIKLAKHADSGKVGLQYILAMPGLLAVARVGDFGASKYGQWNYKVGMPWMSLLGSCSRHLISFIQGEDLDPESKLPHLAHLAYNALMLLDYSINKVGFDDRYDTLQYSKVVRNDSDNSVLPF